MQIGRYYGHVKINRHEFSIVARLGRHELSMIAEQWGFGAAIDRDISGDIYRHLAVGPLLLSFNTWAEEAMA